MMRWRAIEGLSPSERQRALELNQFGAVSVRARRSHCRDYDPDALAAKEALLAEEARRRDAESAERSRADPSYVQPLGSPAWRGTKPWLADVPLKVTREENVELPPGMLLLLDERAWATGRYTHVDPEDDQRLCLMEGLEVGEDEPDTIEEPLRPTAASRRDIWMSDVDHPFVPSGYAYVPEAFAIIGRAKFGPAWMGEEGTFRGNLPPFPRPSVVFAGDSDMIVGIEQYRQGRRAVAAMLGIDPDRRTSTFTNAEWCEATDRWQHYETYGASLIRRRAAVINLLHRACSDGPENGGLSAWVRTGSGRMATLERHVWNCERDEFERRIQVGLVVGGEPSGFPEPFFFERSALVAFTAELNGALAASSDNALRSEPTELSNVSEFSTQRPPVPLASLRDWIEEANTKGWSQDRIVSGLAGAFPDHSVPGRPTIRQIDAEVRNDLGLPARSRGAPKR